MDLSGSGPRGGSGGGNADLSSSCTLRLLTLRRKVSCVWRLARAAEAARMRGLALAGSLETARPCPCSCVPNPGAKIPNDMCKRARSLSLNSCARSRSCTSRRSFPVSVTLSTPSRVRLPLSLSLPCPLSLLPLSLLREWQSFLLCPDLAHSLFHQRSWHPLPY